MRGLRLKGARQDVLFAGDEGGELGRRGLFCGPAGDPSLPDWQLKRAVTRVSPPYLLFVYALSSVSVYTG